MPKVIFDSSFLMAVVERPTTWFEDMVDSVGRFQPVLPDCVRTELEKLAAGEGSRARTARVSLELAVKFANMPCGRARVDDEIVSAALSNGALIATTDGELAKSAKAAHVKVVSLRRGRVAIS